MTFFGMTSSGKPKKTKAAPQGEVSLRSSAAPALIGFLLDGSGSTKAHEVDSRKKFDEARARCVKDQAMKFALLTDTIVVNGDVHATGYVKVEEMAIPGPAWGGYSPIGKAIERLIDDTSSELRRLGEEGRTVDGGVLMCVSDFCESLPKDDENYCLAGALKRLYAFAQKHRRIAVYLVGVGDVDWELADANFPQKVHLLLENQNLAELLRWGTVAAMTLSSSRAEVDIAPPPGLFKFEAVK